MIFTKKNMFFFLFIAVFVACCLFSSKVFAEESIVDYSRTNGVGFQSTSGSSTTIINYNNRYIFYFKSDNKYIYHITNNNNSYVAYIYYSVTEPILNSTVTKVTSIAPGSTYDFIGNGYFLIGQHSPESDPPLVVTTFEPINQYDDTIDNLTQAISLDNLWSQFGVGLIALGVLFAIGFFVVRKVLKKDSQYKG